MQNTVGLSGRFRPARERGGAPLLRLAMICFRLERDHLGLATLSKKEKGSISEVEMTSRLPGWLGFVPALVLLVASGSFEDYSQKMLQRLGMAESLPSLID